MTLAEPRTEGVMDIVGVVSGDGRNLATAPRLIAFCGKPYAGKSTAARRLVDSHGFVRTSFATPLKAMLTLLMRSQGATADEVDKALAGSGKERPCRYLAGATPRQAMQTLGTEWGRALHPEFWVRAWAQALPEGRDIVVDDLRFANEGAAVKRLGGVVVRIVCPAVPGLSGPAAMHASEQESLAVDAEVVNDGDLARLWERVDRLA